LLTFVKLNLHFVQVLSRGLEGKPPSSFQVIRGGLDVQLLPPSAVMTSMMTPSVTAGYHSCSSTATASPTHHWLHGAEAGSAAPHAAFRPHPPSPVLVRDCEWGRVTVDLDRLTWFNIDGWRELRLAAVNLG
jgi:hypothetical protein